VPVAFLYFIAVSAKQKGLKMEIKLAQKGDLLKLKDMYRKIADNMAKSGIEIWDSLYPAEFIAEDIEKGRRELIFGKTATKHFILSALG